MHIPCRYLFSLKIMHFTLFLFSSFWHLINHLGKFMSPSWNKCLAGKRQSSKKTMNIYWKNGIIIHHRKFRSLWEDPNRKPVFVRVLTWRVMSQRFDQCWQVFQEWNTSRLGNVPQIQDDLATKKNRRSATVQHLNEKKISVGGLRWEYIETPV